MDRIAIAKELVAMARMIARQYEAEVDYRAEIANIVKEVKRVKGWKALPAQGSGLIFESPKYKHVRFSVQFWTTNQAGQHILKVRFFRYGEKHGYQAGWQPLWAESFEATMNGSTPKEFEQVIKKNWSKIMDGVDKAKKEVDLASGVIIDSAPSAKSIATAIWNELRKEVDANWYGEPGGDELKSSFVCEWKLFESWKGDTQGRLPTQRDYSRIQESEMKYSSKYPDFILDYKTTGGRETIHPGGEPQRMTWKSLTYTVEHK